MTREEFENEFEKSDDKKRWLLVKENQHLGIVVNLDNDSTFITFEKDEEIDTFLEFDEFIGWDDGIFVLLDAMNIKNESV